LSTVIDGAKAAASDAKPKISRLNGEAAPVFIADKAGHERADRQPEEGERNELWHLVEGRKFALDRRAEHVRADVKS
jgi:hypothetical protein